ncbi:MAG: hypothetical protein ACREO8_06280 [Luteimonas sp.]
MRNHRAAALIAFAVALLACKQSADTVTDAGLSGRDTKNNRVDSAGNFVARHNIHVASVSPETVSDYEAWQRKAGFIRPASYNKLRGGELIAKSKAGDMFASQRLGEQAWENYSDRNAAIEWLQKSAEQGSVAAISQAAMLSDPDSDAMMLKKKQGQEVEGNRIEAYAWARIATLRGDPDGVFGVEKQSKHLTPRQVTEAEVLALEQYQLLQLSYVKQYGHGFVNIFPVDPNAPHNQLIYLRKESK